MDLKNLIIAFECPSCKHQTEIMPATKDIVKFIIKAKEEIEK